MSEWMRDSVAPDFPDNGRRVPVNPPHPRAWPWQVPAGDCMIFDPQRGIWFSPPAPRTLVLDVPHNVHPSMNVAPSC
jgi:hypothetical protein